MCIYAMYMYIESVYADVCIYIYIYTYLNMCTYVYIYIYRYYTSQGPVQLPFPTPGSTPMPAEASETHALGSEADSSVSYAGAVTSLARMFHQSSSRYLNKFAKAKSGWWLSHPSEKYESHLDYYSQYMGKSKMFQTTNQKFYGN